jgi:hypothetical protein
MKNSTVGLWLRGAAIVIVFLGASFALYGRLVRVETKLEVVESQVRDIHGVLFPPAEVAER